MRWVGTLCRGGVHLISVYLFFGEGLSCRNIDLLQAIAGVIGELRGPWILAGDFNITPQDLISTGWLQLVGGTVHAPSLPTCNGRVIDFFVTSATLAFAVVAATVVSDTGTYPHSAVRLLVRASPRCVMVNSLRKPAAFTAVLAAGCAPLGPDYSDVVAVHGMHSATTDNLNLGYTTWIARVENELADVCSLDGHERSLAVGRAMGPQFVLQPALGPVGSDSTRVRPVTAAWQVLAAWLGQLQQALCAQQVLRSRTPHEQNRPWTRCRPECTVARIRLRLMRTDWTHLGNSLEASEFNQWLTGIVDHLLCNLPYVVSTRLATAKRARSLATHDLAERRKSWISWLHGGPSAGLGRQHRMTRIALGWIPSPVAAVVDDDPEYGDCADDAVRLDWAAVWRVGTPEPSPAWPDMLGEPLPPLCVHAFVTACETFAPNTGLGWDRIHPRALLRLSRGAIVSLLRILILCEVLGEWPLAMGVVIIAMLPRTDGGLRPIGLCPGIVRIWMALRMPVARAWQAAHERPFFFAGECKGADVATWKQAARAELATSARAEYAIALLGLTWSSASTRYRTTGLCGKPSSSATICGCCVSRLRCTACSGPCASVFATPKLWLRAAALPPVL